MKFSHAAVPTLAMSLTFLAACGLNKNVSSSAASTCRPDVTISSQQSNIKDLDPAQSTATRFVSRKEVKTLLSEKSTYTFQGETIDTSGDSTDDSATAIDLKKKTLGDVGDQEADLASIELAIDTDQFVSGKMAASPKLIEHVKKEFLAPSKDENGKVIDDNIQAVCSVTPSVSFQVDKVQKTLAIQWKFDLVYQLKDLNVGKQMMAAMKEAKKQKAAEKN